MRAGDFGELPVAIFDPATTNCPGGTNCTRQPFAGQRHSGQPDLVRVQVLPGADAAADALRNRQQLPQQQHGRRIQQLNVNVKVDFNATDAHRFSVLFSRGSHNQSSAIRGNPVPLPLPYVVTRVVDEVPTVGQVKHTWVINRR